MLLDMPQYVSTPFSEVVLNSNTRCFYIGWKNWILVYRKSNKTCSAYIEFLRLGMSLIKVI